MGRPTALENGMTLEEELLATLRAWKQSYHRHEPLRNYGKDFCGRG
jgi:hypothetical protein